MEFSKFRVVTFAVSICLFCSIFVALSAVSLKDRQEANAVLDRQKKVLMVAGLIDNAGRAIGGDSKEPLDPAAIEALFDSQIIPQVIELNTGTVAEGVDPKTFDQQRAMKDPAQSREASSARAMRAKVRRVPNNALVYKVKGEGAQAKSLIFPIEGKGLWSTLYGFVAVSASDYNTVEGITFYQHGETPGLGGEVDNPSWKALWRGRRLADASGEIQLRVVKGIAGDVASAPYQVDGLSGATITSNGVTALVQFWLGDEQGFGKYISRLKEAS